MVMGVKMIEQNKHVRHVIYTLWSLKTQLPRPLPSIILALEQLTPCGDQMTPAICGLDNAETEPMRSQLNATLTHVHLAISYQARTLHLVTAGHNHHEWLFKCV